MPTVLGGVYAQTLNDTFSVELKSMLGSPGDAVSDAAFISIDRLGTDVRVRQGTDYSVQRIGFEQVRASARPAPHSGPTACCVLVLSLFEGAAQHGAIQAACVLPKRSVVAFAATCGLGGHISTQPQAQNMQAETVVWRLAAGAHAG